MSKTDSHSAFPTLRQTPSSQSSAAILDMNAPWIAPEKLPPLRRDFDLNRDLYIKKQILHEEQRAQGGGETPMKIVQNRPIPALTPPPKIRNHVLRQSFNERCLAAHQHAAHAQIKTQKMQQIHAQPQRRNAPNMPQTQGHTPTAPSTGKAPSSPLRSR